MYRQGGFGGEKFLPIRYDSDKCTGCNKCVNICQVDVLIPNGKTGEHPIVAFPEECWYCGSCVTACGEGAISLVHPLMNQVRWIEKDKLTGNKTGGKENEDRES